MSFTLLIQPVDLNQHVSLPKPWEQLGEFGFRPGGEHEDIFLRAKGFYLQCERKGCLEEGQAWLEYAGEGYLNPFNPAKFRIAEDPDADFKRRAITALTELSSDFGRRVPSTVWDTIAFLATRPNPRQYKTILASQEYLPFPYWVADTVLHGLGEVYGFKDHVNTVLFRHTGTVLEHNCDCGCDMHSPNDGGVIEAPLPKDRWRVATAALCSHLCGQSVLITFLKLPFEMGLSPEAAEVMALGAAEGYGFGVPA